MPDITMCEGLDCPKKETCYRFIIEPNQYHQSFFNDPPFDDDRCQFYLNVKIQHSSESIDSSGEVMCS